MLKARRDFVAHPHTKLSLPAVEALSTNPILSTQILPIDKVHSALISFIDAALPASDSQAVKHILTSSVLPYLKDSTAPEKKDKDKKQATPQMLAGWAGATRILADALQPSQLFPLVDMWRIALLDDTVRTWCAQVGSRGANGAVADPVEVILKKGIQVVDSSDAEVKRATRNYLLTTLKMLANGFGSQALGTTLLSPSSDQGKRDESTKILVSSLLHEDVLVRTAAASLAFNIAAFLQKPRVEQVRGSTGSNSAVEEDGDWEVELVSAVLEAISNETQSEEVGT